jgi:hypothetical protein
VVLAQADEARGDLAPEAGRRLGAGRAGSEVEPARVVREAKATNEGLVELGERRGRGRSGGLRRWKLRQFGDEVGERALRERGIGTERRRVAAHQPPVGHDRDLAMRPRSLGSEHGGRSPEGKARADDCRDRSTHVLRIVGAALCL